MVGVERERTVTTKVSQLRAADEDCACFGLYGSPFKLDSSQRPADKHNRLPDVIDDLKKQCRRQRCRCRGEQGKVSSMK
jgi:hypothetical protein